MGAREPNPNPKHASHNQLSIYMHSNHKAVISNDKLVTLKS